MRPLDGVRLKLTRAEEHLDALKDEVARYLEGRPYARVREYHDEHGEVNTGFRITAPPPRHQAVVIGDFTHNLRSALDHLAWQLVIAHGNRPIEGRTAFPIFELASAYQKRIGRVGIIGGVGQACAAVVESLQPYQRGDTAAHHPLAIIRALSNIDKHRHLVLAATMAPRLDWADVGPPGSHQYASRVYWFPRSLLPEESMDMHVQKAILVSLEEPASLRQRPIVVLLGELLQFVRESVVPRFEPFLNEGP